MYTKPSRVVGVWLFLSMGVATRVKTKESFAWFININHGATGGLDLVCCESTWEVTFSQCHDTVCVMLEPQAVLPLMEGLWGLEGPQPRPILPHGRKGEKWEVAGTGDTLFPDVMI